MTNSSPSSSGLRKRKKPKDRTATSNGHPTTSGNAKGKSQDGAPISIAEDLMGLAKILWVAAGLFLLCFSGYWFAWYVEMLHENNMWFTNIQEVEREISLRTEAGLYYSYYKQLVNEPQGKPFAEILKVLKQDNITEHGRSINVLSRFNIYQEVALAAVYRGLNIAEFGVKPIFFYIRSIFKLNGFYVMALYAAAWYMTGSWLAGLLTALQFATNLDDTTRVFFTINLREGFGFPFLFTQVFFLCMYLDRSTTGKWSLITAQIGILTGSFLFAITWQFNQFIMLLQAAAVYALGLLQLAPLWKVRNILFIQWLSLLGVGLFQYYQPMILGSMMLSFAPSAIVMLYLWRNVEMTGGILEGAFRIACQVICVLFVTFWVNWGVKQYIPVEADEHIFKFLKSKFGFGNPLDFESRIYLCHGAFVFLDNDFFRRTSYTLLFPSFFLTMLAFLFLLGKNILLEWCTPPQVDAKLEPGRSIFSRNLDDVSDKPFMLNQRPNIAYLTIQSVLYGILALMTLRMKYVWTPFMTILGSLGLADKEIWENLLSVSKYTRKPTVVNAVRHGLPLAVSVWLLIGLVPRVQTQMNDLREFWDPDTVELMRWIQNNTKPEESFAGSMQLLAGVKCCTGRHITNHPHFEDKWLRDRTKEVYQLYARRHPEEVYAILKKVDAHYIILEDSICLATSDNCRLPDLVDLDNGHVPDNGFAMAGLKKSEIPRFCVEIRYDEERYTNLFKLVMENRTFRVYKVL